MLLSEHSLGRCLSHFPLHFMSPFVFFSFSVHLHSLPHCMLLFFLFSVIIFLPLYLAITPTPCPSYPTHLPAVSLAASGRIHSIKARVLLLLLPLIMKALHLACCQAVRGAIINRRHPSSPSPAITGLITIIWRERRAQTHYNAHTNPHGQLSVRRQNETSRGWMDGWRAWGEESERNGIATQWRGVTG